MLEKAGSVVRALEHLGEASAQQIAERTDEPVSSTYRLLSSLRSLGWVDNGSARGLFRLGLRFVRVASRLEDQMSVRDVCRPMLDGLRHRLNATSFLCFLRGGNAVCVERLPGRDVQSLAMRLGDSLPLHSGGASLALLANLPDQEREAHLARFRDDHLRDPRLAPNVDIVRERVRRTRLNGYAVSDEDVTPGVAAVGAPVLNHRGELEGAVSVSGIRSRILGDEEATARAVTEAARSCSAALGFVSEGDAA